MSFDAIINKTYNNLIKSFKINKIDYIAKWGMIFLALKNYNYKLMWKDNIFVIDNFKNLTLQSISRTERYQNQSGGKRSSRRFLNSSFSLNNLSLKNLSLYYVLFIILLFSHFLSIKLFENP